MHIVVFAANGQPSPLQRARLVAQLLARHATVEVVVPRFEGEAGAEEVLAGLAVRTVAGRTGLHARAMLAEMAERPADLYLASKARPVAVAAAALAARRHGAPYVVDIDDDERYMCAPFSRHALKNLAWGLARAADPNAYPWVRATEALLLPRAAGLTVVSEVFQRRWGGRLLPQAVDTARFDPARFDRDAIRGELGLAGKHVVMFMGTLLPSKGAGVLAEALGRLPDPRLRLVVVGPRNAFAEALARQDPRVVLAGTQPHALAPRWLAAADVVALPQLAGPFTAGQVPIKLVEAMAMAVPVVASAVSDLPAMLDGAGRLVTPGDAGALAAGLEAVLTDPDLAARLGGAARARCVARLSYDALAPNLAGWMATLADRSRRHVEHPADHPEAALV